MKQYPLKASKRNLLSTWCVLVRRKGAWLGLAMGLNSMLRLVSEAGQASSLDSRWDCPNVRPLQHALRCKVHAPSRNVEPNFAHRCTWMPIHDEACDRARLAAKQLELPVPRAYAL